MPQPETITSAANPFVKDVRRAIARGSLTSEGLCVAETFHLLEDALGSPCEVAAVLASESARAAAETHARGHRGVRLVVLPDALFQSVAGTETSQGVIALVRPPEWTVSQLLTGCPLVVVLDGVQDPGNAGTIVRTAEAFGATGVVFLKGTVSPFNAKTLRAAAGSLFRLPYVHGVEAAELCNTLRDHQVTLYAGVPARAEAPELTLAAADLAASCALVVGSEGRGVSRTLLAAARGVSIPTVGVESLNAAVAAGILLYEARRRRSLQP